MDAGYPVEVKPRCKMSQRYTVQGCKQQQGIMIFLHLWTKANRPTEAFPQWPALATPVHRRGDRAPHSRFTGRCRVLSSALNCIMVLNLRCKELSVHKLCPRTGGFPASKKTFSEMVKGTTGNHHSWPPRAPGA